MPERGKVVDFVGRSSETREQLLERLFREYQPALRAFMQMRLSRWEDSEDIIQDTFCRLARINGLEHKLESQRSPKSYIFAIANNLLIDHIRQRQARKPHEAPQNDADSDSPVEITPEAILSSGEELGHVKEILHDLTPKCRTAFVLKRFRQMSGREIARVMGISESRVEKYIARAMLTLREGMEQFRNGGGG